MGKFKPYRAEQLMMFPNSIKDYVGEGHLARVVDAVVERLDTADIEEKYSELGQNTYHPKILVKLLFYGYALGERSGRMIARRIETDTAYIYLAQMYQPDFRTINDFRKNHLKELSGYFVEIVRLSQELGLVKVGQINIDGTKIKADAANRLTKDKEGYQEWLKKTEANIQEILAQADQRDAVEDQMYGDQRGDELPEEINTQEKLKKRLEEVIQRFQDEPAASPLGGKERINFTDADARFMKGGNGKIDANYNCQIAVDGNQMIVASEVITQANDRGALKLMVEASEKTLREPVREVAADSGYSSYENYEYLSKSQKVGYVPDQRLMKVRSREYGPYHEENFRYDERNDCYICPEDEKLIRYKERRQDSSYRQWRQVIYRGRTCSECVSKPLCTQQPQRTLARDDRRTLVDQMRKRLLSKEGREKYLQRLYTAEPVFGHLKHILGYRRFLLRTLRKVQGEFRLMCIGHNLKKIHRWWVLAT